MQSGIPFSALSSTPPATAIPSTRRDPVPCTCEHRDHRHRSNSVSSVRRTETYSISAHDEIDLRAQKEFSIHERVNLKVFGEAFNLANHQNYTGVLRDRRTASPPEYAHLPGGFNSARRRRPTSTRTPHMDPA